MPARRSSQRAPRYRLLVSLMFVLGLVLGLGGTFLAYRVQRTYVMVEIKDLAELAAQFNALVLHCRRPDISL